MARVEIRPSGEYRYVLVVEEDDAGTKQTLRSFGADAPAARSAAKAFVAAVDAGRGLRQLGMDRDQFEGVLLTLVGGLLTGAAIGALLAVIFSDH